MSPFLRLSVRNRNYDSCSGLYFQQLGARLEIMAQGSEHEQEIVILGNSAYGEILDTYLSKRTNLKSRYITIKSEDEKELDALLSDTSLVVCALDDCSFLRLVNINAYCVEKGIICVFVYPSNGVINIGPTVVPGSGHCICCSRLELVSENRSSGYYPFEFGPEAEHFVNLALSQGNLRDSRTCALGTARLSNHLLFIELRD